MKQRYLLFCFLLLATGFSTQAQYTRYIIRFRDKQGTPYTLSNPSAYLSAQAIARRTRFSISIDSTDLPITPAYIDSIKAVPNVTFINQSKWMNQVCIKTSDPAALTKINSFPFVIASSPIAARIAGDASLPSGRQPDIINPSPLRANSPDGVLGNYYNYGNNLPQIHLHQGEYLHNLGFRGENMTVAILDAGFYHYRSNNMFDSLRANHQLLGDYNYVDPTADVDNQSAHGLMCLSTMGANKPGIMTGTSPKAKFWLLKTEDDASEYPVEEQNWVVAAEFSDSAGVDVISTSLGYGDFDGTLFDHSYADRDGHTTLITRGANLAYAKGILVMASAGNEGNDASDFKYVSSPADGDNVFAVGATDVNGIVAGFSSYGPNSSGAIKPNGVSVGLATVVSNIFGDPITASGTSFANPNLAGLMTCFWQAFPEATNREIMSTVQRNSNKYSSPDGRYGYGVPNFKKAFAAMVTARFQGNATSDGCATSLSWTGKDNNSFYYQVERRLDTDTGFIKIGTVYGKTAGFQFNSYIYTDTVKSFSLGQALYRVSEVLPDTVLMLMSASNTITAPCFSLTKDFTVSPNPFRGSLYVNINTSYPIQHLGIELIDVSGRTAYQYNGNASSGKFNLSIPAKGLATGIYVIVIRDGSKILYRQKLLH